MSGARKVGGQAKAKATAKAAPAEPAEKKEKRAEAKEEEERQEGRVAVADTGHPVQRVDSGAPSVESAPPAPAPATDSGRDAYGLDAAHDGGAGAAAEAEGGEDEVRLLFSLPFAP